ncbi:PhzF family phenazine biosynthesis protein [Tabrizicola sp. YIM 78059]|uniref:PhzF family phenazine biosynthesis protein n=1 Tax=Tabrizicola sp. YIM 78059 TaxID=2529861 RepID=UPI0020BDF75D|nr:PhzF family phenazine biosynthesis protein [Tabrizicola sp. YIM 78059]
MPASMLAFHTWDVFTDRPFAGNPLAIVLGANDLTPPQMQTIAREFNLSETIFVQPPRNPANTARVRIFFPTAEIPFAGHPTIGCAIHLACAREAGDFERNLVLEEEAGPVPVRVWRQGGTTGAEFVAPVLPHEVTDAPDQATALEAGRLAAALGLEEAEIGFGAQRPGLWQGGPRFLYVPVAGLDALSRARPIEPFWSRQMQAAGVDSMYLYTPGSGSDYRARMFSPAAGIPEDPATGSASAILAAQLLSSGALPEGEARLALHQGVEMGRPSRIGLTTVVSGGVLKEVRVAGSAVPVSEGRIRVPMVQGKGRS